MQTMNFGSVGVAGLGRLGRGIAACLVGNEVKVIGFDSQKETQEGAICYIDAALGDLINHAGFPTSLTDRRHDLFTAVDQVGDLSGCDFIIESIVEDLEAKQNLFDELEQVVAPEVPVASNTSSLTISSLQQNRIHPQRFLGMHWAEPAHATRFLELIRGDQTSDAAFRVAYDLALKLGKEPSVVEKDVPAFIANRMAYALYREALHILEMGVADAETIDRSFRNTFGLWATLCGPFRWIDLTGGPLLYGKAIQDVLPTLTNETELPETMKQLMEARACGVLNGKGFYQYTDEESKIWESLLHEHAWNVYKLVNKHFPLEKLAD